MANKRINDFAVLESASDDDVLLISSEDTTYNIKVKTLREYLQKSNVSAVAITLYEAAWEQEQQTVAVIGVTADTTSCHVIISPAPDDAIAYGKYGIVCTEQGAGSLTFRYSGATPLSNLNVNILILS